MCERDQKVHKRAVNSVEPAVPHYLRWSEQPIVWSREDHPPRVDNLGQLALIVAPQESALIEFIRENRDIFAWKPSDMPGVPRGLAEHPLNIDPKYNRSGSFCGDSMKSGEKL